MAENGASAMPGLMDIDELERADRLVTLLGERIAGDAREARTARDVRAVAAKVQLLRLHRPDIFDVVATEEVDGSDFREVGFLTDDGTYIGVSTPLLLCGYHDEIEYWPCPDIRLLAVHYGTSTEAVR